jgi:hypothetical protein
MGFADKAKNKAEELAGKAKAATGDATDNRDLEAEGRCRSPRRTSSRLGERERQRRRCRGCPSGGERRQQV